MNYHKIITDDIYQTLTKEFATTIPPIQINKIQTNHKAYDGEYIISIDQQWVKISIDQQWVKIGYVIIVGGEIMFKTTIPKRLEYTDHWIPHTQKILLSNPDYKEELITIIKNNI